MKYYRVTGGDCFAISLVEDPAIESNFIALKKDYRLKLESEKRMITGAVLIPNKPIYRYMDGQEFYISFDEPTIEVLAQNFLLSMSVTISHEDLTEDVVVVESWVKTDELDKSVSLGIDEPIGTWFVSMKVNDDLIWLKIKDGEFKGFSIEAIVGLDELLYNKVDMEKDKEFLEQIKDVINDALGKKAVEADDQEKEAIAARDAEIAQLKEDLAERDAALGDRDKEIEALKAERDELKAKLDEAIASNEAMNVEMEAVKAENVKLSAQPSVEPKKNEVHEDGAKNYNAAVKLMLK